MPIGSSTSRNGSGAKLFVDGAQPVSQALAMRALDVDFSVLPGHKVFGPAGIGAVYGKRELPAHAPPITQGAT